MRLIHVCCLYCSRGDESGPCGGKLERRLALSRLHSPDYSESTLSEYTLELHSPIHSQITPSQTALWMILPAYTLPEGLGRMHICAPR